MARTSIGLMLALWVSLAWAQPRGPADAAPEFVVGHCFRAVAADGISKVKSVARTLKWRSLSSKPVDAEGRESWLATDEGQYYFISVSTDTTQRKKVEHCSVEAHQPPDVLVPLVLKALNTRLLGSGTAGFQGATAGFQGSETYELEHPTQPRVFLTITRGKDKVRFSFSGLH
jgi:hypothetical protein